MLEHYNQLWFDRINAAAGLTGWPLLGATALAEWPVWLVPCSLLTLWLIGSIENRQAAVKALVTILGALLVNQGLALVWFHARPFMDGVGHTYLPHVPDSSFPSDHITVMMSAGLAFWIAPAVGSRRIGGLLIALIPAVGWARVFLGIHYPFDILGAAAVAAAMTIIVNTAFGQSGCRRLTEVFEAVYRHLLAGPIARGWIRA